MGINPTNKVAAVGTIHPNPIKTRKEIKVDIGGVPPVGTRTLIKETTKVGTHKTFSHRVAEAMALVEVEEITKTVSNVSAQDIGRGSVP